VTVFEPSPRDRELLFGYTQGLTLRQIANVLGVTTDAVSVYASRMHLRMGARDRAQAVHIAYQLRILTVGGAS
jgi:DNA-binding NarL/FixJ family response regulator